MKHDYESIHGLGQRGLLRLARKMYIKIKAFWILPAINTYSRPHPLEENYGCHSHSACSRPHNTVSVQSPPSNDAVSFVPCCRHCSLRSLSEVAGNPHPRLSASGPNIPTLQAPHKYRLGLVTTSNALNSIMRPCGQGKMPGSAGSSLDNSTLKTGPMIGRKEAVENSDAQGMHAHG